MRRKILSSYLAYSINKQKRVLLSILMTDSWYTDKSKQSFSLGVLTSVKNMCNHPGCRKSSE